MVHHGGAGTIAAGLQLGLPTMVVPFFGDQHLWGAQVARLGVGPPPVPMASLSVDRLTEGFRLLRRSRYREAAARLARQVRVRVSVRVRVRFRVRVGVRVRVRVTVSVRVTERLRVSVQVRQP